jgi:hypothetical protein
METHWTHLASIMFIHWAPSPILQGELKTGKRTSTTFMQRKGLTLLRLTWRLLWDQTDRTQPWHKRQDSPSSDKSQISSYGTPNMIVWRLVGMRTRMYVRVFFRLAGDWCTWPSPAYSIDGIFPRVHAWLDWSAVPFLLSFCRAPTCHRTYENSLETRRYAYTYVCQGFFSRPIFPKSRRKPVLSVTAGIP